jgi:hypothetical protein
MITPSLAFGVRIMSSQKKECLTISVPEAGARYFGYSKNHSYVLASKGLIPVVRVGRALRVPVKAMEKMLEAAEVKPAA